MDATMDGAKGDTMDGADTIEMSIKARTYQGMHETEVSVGGRSDLPALKLKCEKNPNHTKFICAERLSLKDFSDKYQDNDILELVKLQADMTVCLCVMRTSDSRPATYPGSNKPYPFYGIKDKMTMRTGTGSILLIHDYDSRNTNTKCQCNECKVSGKPKEKWGKIIIETANHVVFDEEESDHTDIELFYDNENREHVYKLRGRLMSRDIKSDWCLIYCPTHDTELIGKLQSSNNRFETLRKQLYDKYKTSESNLVVIVSHPHGLCKQITVGEFTDREELNDSTFTRYTYTADTCPGSSGARVWVLAEHGECRWACHLHSEGLQSGKNRSGVGWY